MVKVIKENTIDGKATGLNMNDELFMQRALELALQGKGYTSPNPMVGAVIVKNNKVIAEGFHARCGEDHAETAALKKCKGNVAKGATLYVNLEPCFHEGRTPPCVDAVIAAGIKEVVIAMKDPNPLTNGKSIRKLNNAGITTRVGILGDQAGRLNEAFVKFIKEGMPFVVAKVAQTIDGKIATTARDSMWITSEKTREMSRTVRAEFDAILVGVNTMMVDDPRLEPQDAKKVLKKIIVDTRLRVPLISKIFKKPEQCIVATTNKAALSQISLLKHKGIEVIVCPVRNNKVDLKWLFKELAKENITSILIEGGSEVIGSALKEGLVDKMHIYIAPKIVGDQKALSSVTGMNISKIEEALQLKDLQVLYFHPDIRIEGYVLRNS
ncbi:MAG: bifunctional diaminohydroxyphosphoribosylaminopyrimidine deaminase/5-amino-6-(5-phosphoribosylamino)uracil reductase RibD [Candidatus Omnitrophica bacterium]|nr:bifunctional diaminohydroxyphosphoribosylaminopyrimidine deaminase/5-amino-6-(5-phosphoribosylamino)uracil reductase RibD [Candidatus Omnitrophota bacterium]